MFFRHLSDVFERNEIVLPSLSTHVALYLVLVEPPDKNPEMMDCNGHILRRNESARASRCISGVRFPSHPSRSQAIVSLDIRHCNRMNYLYYEQKITQ
jgi:hypothetical protein